MWLIHLSGYKVTDCIYLISINITGTYRESVTEHATGANEMEFKTGDTLITVSKGIKT